MKAILYPAGIETKKLKLKLNFPFCSGCFHKPFQGIIYMQISEAPCQGKKGTNYTKKWKDFY